MEMFYEFCVEDGAGKRCLLGVRRFKEMFKNELII